MVQFVYKRLYLRFTQRFVLFVFYDQGPLSPQTSYLTCAQHCENSCYQSNPSFVLQCVSPAQQKEKKTRTKHRYVLKTNMSLPAPMKMWCVCVCVCGVHITLRASVNTIHFSLCVFVCVCEINSSWSFPQIKQSKNNNEQSAETPWWTLCPIKRCFMLIWMLFIHSIPDHNHFKINSKPQFNIKEIPRNPDC